MKIKIRYEVLVFLQSLMVTIADKTQKNFFYVLCIFWKKMSVIQNLCFSIIATFFSLPYFLGSTFGLLILISSARIKDSI